MRASHLLQRPLPPRGLAQRRLAARQRTKAPARSTEAAGDRRRAARPGPLAADERPQPAETFPRAGERAEPPARLSNYRVATSGGREVPSSCGARHRGEGRDRNEPAVAAERKPPRTPLPPRRPARPPVPRRLVPVRPVPLRARHARRGTAGPGRPRLLRRAARPPVRAHPPARAAAAAASSCAAPQPAQQRWR